MVFMMCKILSQAVELQLMWELYFKVISYGENLIWIQLLMKIPQFIRNSMHGFIHVYEGNIYSVYNKNQYTKFISESINYIKEGTQLCILILWENAQYSYNIHANNSIPLPEFHTPCELQITYPYMEKIRLVVFSNLSKASTQ